MPAKSTPLPGIPGLCQKSRIASFLFSNLDADAMLYNGLQAT
jgi:hypothetical protein